MRTAVRWLESSTVFSLSRFLKTIIEKTCRIWKQNKSKCKLKFLWSNNLKATLGKVKSIRLLKAESIESPSVKRTCHHPISSLRLINQLEPRPQFSIINKIPMRWAMMQHQLWWYIIRSKNPTHRYKWSASRLGVSLLSSEKMSTSSLSKSRNLIHKHKRSLQLMTMRTYLRWPKRKSKGMNFSLTFLISHPPTTMSSQFINPRPDLRQNKNHRNTSDCPQAPTSLTKTNLNLWASWQMQAGK